MLTELINEIYQNQKQESSIDQCIEITSTKTFEHGLTLENFSVNKKTDSLDVGNYSIFNFKNLYYDVSYQIYLIKHLAKELKNYLTPKNKKNVLVVGLGNRHISADSLGSKVVKNLIITNHIPGLKTLTKMSAIAPSVLGLTGIESYDIISSIVNKTNPTLVIAIDSLCASSYSRLGTSFQINNASIIPGGGVNNKRKKIDSKTLNTDFLSIGVPLVIYANTFCDSPKKNIKNLVVTLKDIEEVSSICSTIISYAINMAVHGLTISQVKDYLNKI